MKPVKKDEKRRILKAAGWKRRDLGNVERWNPPWPATDRSSCLGCSLQTAWNTHLTRG